MIGSLLYLTVSRPDIVFSVGLCARFQANPKKFHLTVVKRILRYFKGTIDLCLWYPKGSNFNLVGYADVNYAGFLVDRKSTSGMIKRILNEEPNSSVLVNLNAKADQAQDSENSDDSFKSASEGEGPGSSDSEKTQNLLSKVSSALAENLENRFVLVGPVRDVEIPELERSDGKKNIEKEKEREGVCVDVRGKGKGVADEPGSSITETLADLIKKVGASYDPKKRRTTTPKAPSAAKPSKTRKASSPTTTKTPLPKGRATRSRVKQSESDLQKALAESKKKRMDKGKGKVEESSKVVDVKEMEQVHQEDHTTMEVQTPKPKMSKTSSKKSSSVSKVIEPSLTKRTRSAVKKQIT
ncbi:uncharacterized protein [Nicotiana sylvestris]|uniref:uncharacterized protein n=1 Tax=Nicotiana sylvestris TaxID=4096 RepID=UPI00388C41C5